MKPTKRNEVSGKKAKSIAGRLLRNLAGVDGKQDALRFVERGLKRFCSIGDIQTLAGSVTTQSPDKPTRKHIRKPNARNNANTKP